MVPLVIVQLRDRRRALRHGQVESLHHHTRRGVLVVVAALVGVLVPRVASEITLSDDVYHITTADQAASARTSMPIIDIITRII